MGTNPFGEPRYRAIWGWKSYDWIGGEFNEFDAHGNFIRTVGELRYEPRYMLDGLERWWIETWCPPEIYGSRWAWEMQFEIVNGICIPQLGPFPSRGKYEPAIKIEKPDGSFQQLTLGIVTEFCRRARYSKKFTYQERLRAIRDREEKKQLAIDKQRREILSGDGPLISEGRNQDYQKYIEKETQDGNFRSSNDGTTVQQANP